MDAVVLWLDTTDKHYISQRDKDFGETTPYDIHRLGRRDELRFCLRSLYYNAPWLRTIYLVTWDKQFPDWLDETQCASLTPPIVKIKRETLNEGRYLYGSLAVEACMYKIPGLSELFLYANCDTFLTQPVQKSDWVEDGIGLLQIDKPILSMKPQPSRVWNYDGLTQIGLFLKQFGKPHFRFFKPSHHITILSKQAYKDTVEAFPELYEATVTMKGRELKERITRALIEYVSIHKGYCKINRKRIRSYYLNFETDYKNYSLPNDAVLLCTNLNAQSNYASYDDYIRFMIELFPTPLPCETHLNYEQVCYYTYKRKAGSKRRKTSAICRGRPSTAKDDPCLLPEDTTYNILKHIPYVRKTMRRRPCDRSHRKRRTTKSRR
jgi:hypothetical protein